MVVGFAIRGGLLVGAVYYTHKIGVWGSPKETERIFEEVKTEMQPYMQRVEKSLPFEVPSLPDRGELRYLLQHYYNEGIKGTFNFIHMLPSYIGEASTKLQIAVSEFANSPQPSVTAIIPKPTSEDETAKYKAKK